MTNTASSINAKRQASLNAKKQGLVAGYQSYDDSAILEHRENLVGVELDIASDGIHSNIETKNGPATLIYATRVSDGVELKFWAGKPIESQLTRMDVSTIGDFLWTITERHYTDKRGVAQVGYFLDYSDGTNGMSNGNTPATNRARVASQKSSKSTPRQSEMIEEEEEEEEENAIPELTMAEFDRLPKSKQIAFMQLMSAGKARLAQAPTTPMQKAASKQAPVKTPVKAPVKTTPTEANEIISFGVGEFELGRGRRPKAVTDALANGETVYYSRKTGAFYADDKKTVIYRKLAQ